MPLGVFMFQRPLCSSDGPNDFQIRLLSDQSNPVCVAFLYQESCPKRRMATELLKQTTPLTLTLLRPPWSQASLGKQKELRVFQYKNPRTPCVTSRKHHIGKRHFGRPPQAQLLLKLTSIHKSDWNQYHRNSMDQPSDLTVET